MDQSCVAAFTLYGMENKKKLASRTFIHDRHVLKGNRSVLSLKNKNEDADDTLIQMICKNVLNVVFLIESVLPDFALH